MLLCSILNLVYQIHLPYFESTSWFTTIVSALIDRMLAPIQHLFKTIMSALPVQVLAKTKKSPQHTLPLLIMPSPFALLQILPRGPDDIAVLYHFCKSLTML